jgi:hypothetical protein
MKLDEALQFISSLGYTITKTEKRKWFRKSYLIYTAHSDKDYLFMLDKGKLHKEIPLKSGNGFWAELEEIR